MQGIQITNPNGEELMIFFAITVYLYQLLVNLLITRRDEMQQRFCSVCGFPIWVQYRISQAGSRAVFLSRDDIRAEHLHKCPCCWKSVDINTLS